MRRRRRNRMLDKRMIMMVKVIMMRMKILSMMMRRRRIIRMNMIYDDVSQYLYSAIYEEFHRKTGYVRFGQFEIFEI